MSLLTNTKTLWIIIIALVILNILSISSVWIIQKRGPFPGRGMNSNPGRQNRQVQKENFLVKELELSKTQQAEFDTLTARHRENLSVLNDEIAVLRKELVQRMKNQEFDSTSEDLITQIGHKQAEIELINFRNFRNIMGICDAQQKETFLGIMQRAFRPRRNEFENRGRPGAGDRNNRPSQTP